MNLKEWHEYAIKQIEHGMSEIAAGRQALIDARKALVCAQEPLRTHQLTSIMEATLDTAPRLQDLLNALRCDPILDEPMDIHSAGDCDEEPIAEADAAETFARNCEKRRAEKP